MSLRHIPITVFPRTQQANRRGEEQWFPNWDAPVKTRMGITVDRTSRAEVRGNVEIEVYQIRIPASIQGVGPGATILWDDAEWDVVAPPMVRPTRTHSVRHQTVQIRRRPYTDGGRE